MIMQGLPRVSEEMGLPKRPQPGRMRELVKEVSQGDWMLRDLLSELLDICCAGRRLLQQLIQELEGLQKTGFELRQHRIQDTFHFIPERAECPVYWAWSREVISMGAGMETVPFAWHPQPRLCHSVSLCNPQTIENGLDLGLVDI